MSESPKPPPAIVAKVGRYTAIEPLVIEWFIRTARKCGLNLLSLGGGNAHAEANKYISLSTSEIKRVADQIATSNLVLPMPTDISEALDEMIQLRFEVWNWHQKNTAMGDIDRAAKNRSHKAHVDEWRKAQKALRRLSPAKASKIKSVPTSITTSHTTPRGNVIAKASSEMIAPIVPENESPGKHELGNTTLGIGLVPRTSNPMPDRPKQEAQSEYEPFGTIKESAVVNKIPRSSIQRTPYIPSKVFDLKKAIETAKANKSVIAKNSTKVNVNMSSNDRAKTTDTNELRDTVQAFDKQSTHTSILQSKQMTIENEAVKVKVTKENTATQATNMNTRYSLRAEDLEERFTVEDMWSEVPQATIPSTRYSLTAEDLNAATEVVKSHAETTQARMSKDTPAEDTLEVNIPEVETWALDTPPESLEYSGRYYVWEDGLVELEPEFEEVSTRVDHHPWTRSEEGRYVHGPFEMRRMGRDA